MKYAYALLFAGLFGLTAPAYAEEKPNHPDPKHQETFSKPPHEKHHPFFERIDTNKDKKIDKTENQKFSEDMFNELDLDKDGFITEEEMEKKRDQYKAERDRRGPPPPKDNSHQKHPEPPHQEPKK